MRRVVAAVAVGAASLGVACAEAVGEAECVTSVAAVMADGEGKEKLTLQPPYLNIVQNLCALLGIYLTFARRLIP